MSVSRCQRCQEEITIPPGLAPSSEVQCPLCQDVFELAEVLDAAPPALIVVNAVPSTSAELAKQPVAAAFGSFDPDDVAAPAFSLDSPPSEEGSFGDLQLEDSPETTPFSAPADAGTTAAPKPTPAKM